MSDKRRFEMVYDQGFIRQFEIWVDRETGVNYLWVQEGGITPLLDKEGKPVIEPVNIR